jgi:hypothetical protein
MTNPIFEKYDVIGSSQIDFYKKFIVSKDTGLRDLEISENVRFETLAYKYYGDQKYYWVLPFVNNFEDVFFSLPLTTTELAELAQARIEAGLDTDLNTEFNKLLLENESKKFLKVLPEENLLDMIKKINKQK